MWQGVRLPSFDRLFRLCPMIRLLFAAWLVLMASAAWAQPAPAGMQVQYTGELIDGDRHPISGIFRLVFELFEPGAEAAAWTETHHVSVGEGQFSLLLGQTTPVPAALDTRRLTMRVRLVSGEEIARHELTVRRHLPPTPSAGPAFERITFADLAARAIRADHVSFAENGQRLGDQTVGELLRNDEIEARIAELRERLRTDGGAQIGDEFVYSGPVGGRSGNPYQHTCPAGYAVTGLRGGAGQLIDGMVGICTQIR